MFASLLHSFDWYSKMPSNDTILRSNWMSRSIKNGGKVYEIKNMKNDKHSSTAANVASMESIATGKTNDANALVFFLYVEISILHRVLQMAQSFVCSCFFLSLLVLCRKLCLRIQFKWVESFFKHYHSLVPLTQWNTQTITKVTTNYRVYILRIVCEWFLNCVYGCNTQPGFFFRFILFSPKTFTCRIIFLCLLDMVDFCYFLYVSVFCLLFFAALTLAFRVKFKLDETGNEPSFSHAQRDNASKSFTM